MMTFSLKNQELPFVSIVLPVFNEERYLELCLKTLRQIEYPKEKYEIITVDNGSSDNSFSIAKQYADQALFLPDVKVGAVRNFGAKYARGAVLVFLDSDCLVPANWLHLGVDLLFAEEKHVYGGNYHLRKHPFWIEKFWLLGDTSDRVSHSELVGGCIFILKDAFFSVDGFDESVTSGEDSALSNALANMGYKVVIDSRIGVVHLGNPGTVIEFVKRQIWHSENYVKSIGDSLKDKMFWLVIMYFIGTLGLFLSGFLVPDGVVFFAIVAMCPPAILSAKRIVRANFKPKSIVDLISIFVIDNLYLIGRALGILKGFVKLVPRMR